VGGLDEHRVSENIALFQDGKRDVVEAAGATYLPWLLASVDVYVSSPSSGERGNGGDEETRRGVVGGNRITWSARPPLLFKGEAGAYQSMILIDDGQRSQITDDRWILDRPS